MSKNKKTDNITKLIVRKSKWYYIKLRWWGNNLKKIFSEKLFKFNNPNLTFKEWQDLHQIYEKEGWGKCEEDDVMGEERKQPVYARLMGLNIPYNAQGKSILDVGGGPISILLKTKNFSQATVVDPCNYPESIINRYKEKNIKFVNEMAENYMSPEKFDEVWCYNVLQHTFNPDKVLENMKKNSKGIIRIFDWVYEPVSIGHPQFITREMIENAFNTDGWEWESFKEEKLNEGGCGGRAVFGIAKIK